MPVIAKQKAPQQPATVSSTPDSYSFPAVKKFRRLPKYLLYAALCAVLLSAWLGWRAHTQAQIRFETVAIERGSIQASITATGTLNPVVNVQVGSQVSGNIKALYADFNTQVKQGQLVALIDPQIFQAQVDQSKSAAASADSAVITAEAQVTKVRADLAGAIAGRDNLEAILAKDRANALNAQLQWQRSEGLFKEGVISQQDHDSAKAAYDAYEAQVIADQSQIDAAGHNIQSVRAQVNVAITQLATAQAQARQAKAALAQAAINLDHTRIVAPVSGTVIARHFDVGQTVAASFQAPDIFDIAQDLTKMQVDTNVDESDVGTIRAGQSASFRVDAYPNIVFRGVVTDVRKAPIITQNVVTYDVVVTVGNPDLKLFPGMTANVTILTAQADNVLKVPNAVLRFHPSAEIIKRTGIPAQSAPTIYLLTKGKLKAVPVKFGLSDGQFTEVSGPADLKAGDMAVVRAIAQGQSSGGKTQTSSPVRRLPGM